MRPNPSQKPQTLLNPPEKSEEVRRHLATLTKTLISLTPPQQLTAYLDEIVTVLRGLAMDPASPEVIQEASTAIQVICEHCPSLLLHYSEPIARSLFTAIVHKQWKVRRAGIQALGKVLYCSTWKYTSNIIEQLVGFRDPNVVPIKDFYEPSTKLNYIAMLVNDRSANVRESFFRVLGDWLMHLPDKFDIESRMIPYILTGLFDPIPEIRELCFEQIEALGQLYEKEKEKEIRDMRQLGYQEDWTCEGQLVGLPLPDPFFKRPRLGARLYFRQYVRRYFNAIFVELADWISTSRSFSANLLLALVIFTEDFVTQNLDAFLSNMYKAIVIPQSDQVLSSLMQSIKLVGRFVDPASYLPQVISALKVSEKGALLVLKSLIAGTVEALPEERGLYRLQPHLSSLSEGLQQDFTENGIVVNSLEALLEPIAERKEELGDISSLISLLGEFMYIAFKSESLSETSCRLVLNACYTIDSEVFFEQLREILDNLCTAPVEHWHTHDENWKMFRTITEHLNEFKDREAISRSIRILQRAVSSLNSISIHKNCLGICRFSEYEKEDIVIAVILPCLQTLVKCKNAKAVSTIRLEALNLLGLYEKINERIINVLVASLTDESVEVQNAILDYLNLLLRDIHMLVLDSEELVEEFSKENTLSALVSALVPKFSQSEISISVVTHLLKALPQVFMDKNTIAQAKQGAVSVKNFAGKFEETLVGDLGKVITDLCGLVLNEDEGPIRQLAHSALKVVKERNPKAILYQALNARQAGMLKRYEYLDTLLQAP